MHLSTCREKAQRQCTREDRECHVPVKTEYLGITGKDRDYLRMVLLPWLHALALAKTPAKLVSPEKKGEDSFKLSTSPSNARMREGEQGERNVKNSLRVTDQLATLTPRECS
jgi:hypothetical protein